MRALILAALLVGCTEPAPRAPPDVLARMKPHADTSHNPTLKTYGSSWSLFGNSAERSSTGQYFTGCGGCSSDDPSGLLVLLAALPLATRRRRP